MSAFVGKGRAIRRTPTIAGTLVAVVALVVAVAAAALVGGGSAGAAQSRYPVPYNFLTSALLASPNADADPPGANDWTCRPSAAHPEPVVLVHGLAGNKNTNWQTFAPLLANNGYCVFALTYGVMQGATLPLNQLGGFATDGVERAAAGRVRRQGAGRDARDQGRHPRTFRGHRGARLLREVSRRWPRIAKYVSLAPIWHGTNPAGLATLDRARPAIRIEPGRRRRVQRVLRLWAGVARRLAVHGQAAVRRHAGRRRHRLHKHRHEVRRVGRAVHEWHPGRHDGTSPCRTSAGCDYSEHLEIAADPVAAADVLNALDPAHPRPVPCRLVLPFVGLASPRRGAIRSQRD